MHHLIRNGHMSNDEIVVYWAVHTGFDRQTYINLFLKKPVSLASTLPMGNDGQHGNYRQCSALPDVLKNTYTIFHPLTTTATLSGDLNNPVVASNENGVWRPRSSSLKNHYTVDLDFGWLFFSEEPLKMKVTPAYFHNTSDSKTGFVASGVFDIGRWFRPVRLTYNLWEGNNTLSATQDEPAVYIEFLTDKKVVFKHFEATNELLDISNQVINSTEFFRFKPISYRYKRFIESNRHKRVLKLIKDNLLE